MRWGLGVLLVAGQWVLYNEYEVVVVCYSSIDTGPNFSKNKIDFSASGDPCILQPQARTFDKS